MPRIRHGTALAFDAPPDADHRKLFERFVISATEAFEHNPLWMCQPITDDPIGKHYNAKLTPDTFVSFYYREFSEDPGNKHLYSDLKAANFPLCRFDGTVLHPPEPEEGQHDTWIRLQANFFPDGVILAFTAFHVGIDLVTEAISVAKWSELFAETYDGDVDPVELLPAECYDRSPLSQGNDAATEADMPDCHVFNVLEMPQQEEPSHAVVLFHIDANSLRKLKHAASSTDAKKWISTADALEAFVWRHIVRARDRVKGITQATGNSKILSGMNLRGRIDQPVPAEFVGACTAMAPMELPRDLMHSREPSALNQIAYFVRTRLGEWNSAQWLNNMIGLLKKVQIPEFVWFKDPGELLFTDHSAFPCYVMNWGPELGAPVRWREPYISREPPKGEVMVLPKLLDGSLEIMVTLENDAMRALIADPEFRQFVGLHAICQDGDGGSVVASGRPKL